MQKQESTAKVFFMKRLLVCNIKDKLILKYAYKIVPQILTLATFSWACSSLNELLALKVTSSYA
jgi:hypothetical protein